MAIDFTSGGLIDSSASSAWDMTSNTDQMSVMFRVWPDSLSSAVWIFGITGGGDGVEIAFNNATTMIVYLFGQNTGNFTHGLNVGQWNNFIYTWDQGTNLLTVEVNGTSRKSASYTNNSGVTGGTLAVAQANDGTAALNGKLADFVALNTIATADQKAAFNANVSPVLFAPLSTIRDCYNFIGGNIISTTGATALAASGTTAASDHPAVYMPDGGGFMVPSAGIIDTLLTIQSATHGHSADNLALTQVHSLTTQDATHGHTAGNVSLTQAHLLNINEALHSHAADNLTLTQSQLLIVSDGTHGHSADNLALTQAHSLAIQDGLHGHSADNLALTQAHLLAIDAALHGQVSDNVVLSLADVLAISDGAHGHTADNIILTQAQVLAINEAVHVHLGDNIDLTQAHTLVINDALHAHLADNVSLTPDVTGLPTPFGRVFVVESENRVVIVGSESRVRAILAENRNKIIEAD